MKNGQGHISPRLFGEAEDVGVQRGLAEFRAGRPVIIQAASEAVFALPVEGGDAQRFAAFNTLLAPASPRLAITARRAKALGLDAPGPVLLELTPSDDWDAIFPLASGADPIAFGLSHRGRVRFAALRLRRPAAARADAAVGSRRRRHPVPGAGGPRPRAREQDARLRAAGRRPRYGRRQHHARVRQ